MHHRIAESITFATLFICIAVVCCFFIKSCTEYSVSEHRMVVERDMIQKGMTPPIERE